jgi:aryl-alcohol dehydrogenase-like predicted oxidoreductase
VKYAQLGRSGLKVSRLCLGTMNFGPDTKEADAFKIMDRALELGINFFDTANVYGWKHGEGVTEKIIGKWFDLGGGRREKVVLATKIYGEMGDWPNQNMLSALHFRRACEDSLKRLRTDFIDLYQMHHVDRDTPFEEVCQAMEGLVAAGKIVYAGSSNFAAWHLVRFNETARQRHFLGLVSEQSLYNLNARTVESEVVPACQEYGIGIIPWSPLGGGFLGGLLSKGKKGRRRAEALANLSKQDRAKVEAYEKLCSSLGEHPANVALAWLLQAPGVTAPIIGPSTLQQLNDCIRALEIKLEETTLKKLDEIFPGPGVAPEGYAW